jgi:tetratricopeptide (TPR) repeat protein
MAPPELPEESAMPECPRCGEELEPGSRFCGNCGLEVEAPGPAPGPSPPPSAPGGDQARRESYLKTGWHLFKQYPGGFIGFTALALLIQMGLGSLPKVGWVVIFIYYPLMFGFVAVSAGLLQGENRGFGDFFKGFNSFLTLLLLGVVSQVMIILGLVLLIVPGIYLMVGYIFAPWFVLDRRVGFWEAMELSRHAVQPHWFELFGLVLMIILINLLGALALGLGLLVTIPVSWCALTAAYATLVGFHSQPQPLPAAAPVGRETAAPPGKHEMPQPPAGVAERGLAGNHDWAPVLTLIGFIVVLAAAGIYFWKFSPTAAPQKPVNGPAKTTRKPAVPLTAQIYLKRGDEAKEAQEKISHYSKAIEIDPNYAIAYNNRGNVYYDRDEFRLALNDYNKAIAIRPDYAIALNNRGMVYFIKRDYEKALKDFNKAIEVKHDYAYAYNNRGMVYYNKNDDDQALNDFNKAIKLNRGYIYSYNNRGNVFYRQKNYEAAINDYTKAITLKPDFSFAYCNRGYAYFTKEDYEKALTDYNKALAINPAYAMAYYRRALLYKKTGDYDKARADYDKAASLHPRWLDTSFPLPEGK